MENWYKIAVKNREPKETFSVGDKVMLKDDVLGRHSRSVPAHAGFTTEQFKWRDLLGSLAGKIGTIQRLFEGSKHVNVDFDGQLIGIDNTELEKVPVMPHNQAIFEQTFGKDE